MNRRRVLLTMTSAVLCGIGAWAEPQAQQPPPVPAAQAPGAPAPGRGGGRGGPQVVSPQIEADGRVTFRILAPNATTRARSAATSTAASCRTLPRRLRAACRAGRAGRPGRRRHTSRRHDERRRTGCGAAPRCVRSGRARGATPLPSTAPRSSTRATSTSGAARPRRTACSTCRATSRKRGTSRTAPSAW